MVPSPGLIRAHVVYTTEQQLEWVSKCQEVKKRWNIVQQWFFLELRCLDLPL